MPQVDITMSADEHRLWQAQQKLLGQQGKMEKGYHRIRKAGKGAGDTIQGTLKKIAGPLAAGGTILIGLRTVVGFFDQMSQRAKESATGIETLTGNLKRLVQISGGEKAVFAKYKELAGELTTKYGVERTRAYGLIFEAKSLGFTDKEIRNFGKMRAFAPEVAPLVTATGGLRAAFGPQVGGGTERSVINSLLAAAEVSKIGVTEIAQHVLTPAQLVKRQKGTFEESLAILGVITAAAKSTEEAATQIGGIAVALEKHPETRGLGIIGGVQRLAEMNKEDRRKVLTEIRAAKGYGAIIENLPQILDVLQSIHEAQALTGTDRSRIAQATRLAEEVPELVAVTAAERARGKRVIAEEQVLGVPQKTREAIRDMLFANLVESGAGVIAQGVSSKFMKEAERFLMEPEKMRDLAESLYRQNLPIESQMGWWKSALIQLAIWRAGPGALRDQAQIFPEREERVDDFREAVESILELGEELKREVQNLNHAIQSTGRATLGPFPERGY